MTEKIDFTQELSEFIFASKYARYNEKEKRRETWEEAVARVEKMHLKRFAWLSKEDVAEIRWAFDRVREKLVVPSMRSLQFGGKAIEAHEARQFNCLHKSTKFITRYGVKSFEEFKDGDETIVLTHKGRWKKAKVRCYGKDNLLKIVISRVTNFQTLYATKDHRWILKDGTFSSEIKEGDILYGGPNILTQFSYENASPFEKLYWAYGFVYGDGTLVRSKDITCSMVRLCKNDKRYKERFEELGFSTSSPLSCGGDFIAYTGKYLKTRPDPMIDSPQLIRAFVSGYCDADAAKNRNGYSRDKSRTHNRYSCIQSSDQDHIKFIRECFPIAGIYLVSEKDLTGQETNFGIRPYTIQFRITNSLNNQTNSNTPFIVRSITDEGMVDNVWCLEVEDDQSFVFPSGLTTGNCSVRHVDSIRAFSEIFYLLLCGCGAGIGLSKKFLARLPDLVKAEDKTGIIVSYSISDIIEGWADSVEALLMCYFRNTAYTGRKIVFDYSRIRKKGAPLKTGGGKAPGYKGLKHTHLKIKELLDHIIEVNSQTRMKSIDAYSILMQCGEAVLSGGVRRTATSIVFDPDDEDMINAKTYFEVDKFRRFAKDDDTKMYYGQVIIDKKIYDVELSEEDYTKLKEQKIIGWFPIAPERARSNNSVRLDRKTITKERFREIIARTRQFGEPGFAFTSSDEQLFNPCVSGDTEILAFVNNKWPISIPIKDVEDKIITTWNGIDWSDVHVKRTAKDQPLLTVRIESSSLFGKEIKELRCTPYHKWYDLDGNQIETKDLKAGMMLEWWVAPFTSCIIGQKVVEVIDKGEREDVFCFNEPLRHRGVFNGILTGQCFEVGFIPVTKDGRCGVQFCNLTSQNGAKIDSEEKFMISAKAAALIGTLQAAYTHFPYLSNAAKELTEEEALLGVSITGIMENPKILLDPNIQRKAASVVKETNKIWAAKLKINPAARCCVVKPEGTSSLTLGTSSGLHPHHAYRFFRRVQCNRTDNIFKHFKKTNPIASETSVWAPKTDEVITFPITVPQKAIIKADLTAIQHLEYIRSTQKNWVEAGTSEFNRKPITHAVSCTVVVKDDEWDQVADYLYENREFFAAVSLLSSNGDKVYDQAPLEAITTPENEQQWNDLVTKWQHVDYKMLKEDDDETDLQAESACSGGKCEL